MVKKKFAAVIFALICCICFAACSKGGKSDLNLKLAYHDYGPAEPVSGSTVAAAGEIEFNNALFYRNDLKSLGADPSAIYVTEGKEKGYFYMYATSDDIGATGVQCWRSKDLVNWECRGVAFAPSRDSWALRNYWAPEVIYDDELDTYFMYYCADAIEKQDDGQTPTGYNDKCMGLATSKTPYGPFEHYVDVKNGITVSTPLFDFRLMENDDPLKEPNNKHMKVIDPSPFKDPDTGEKYLYFVHDLGGDYSESSIYAIKMTDWYTPDYTQVKKLTSVNRVTCTANSRFETKPEDKSLYEGNQDNQRGVNEAPFMYKHNGKYYLTYSVNNYESKNYSVRVAVGDSPMGPFTKLTKEEGGWTMYAEGDYASGTGHHAFVEAGDELFIVYHAHTLRQTGGGSRAIAGDRVYFVDNGKGVSVPYVNGPTYSLQPLAAAVSGYKNVAPLAKISASSMSEGSKTSYLNDGLVKHHDIAFIGEFEAAGNVTITLEFDSYVTTRALMIFNSHDYDYLVPAISRIEFQFKSGKNSGVAYTDRLLYDYAAYTTYNRVARPGGSFAIEYADLDVKKITITVRSGTDESGNPIPFRLSDIVVLGK